MPRALCSLFTAAGEFAKGSNSASIALRVVGNRLRVEGRQVALHLLQSIHIEIDHMPGRVICELNVVAQLRFKTHMSQVVFRDEERCSQIEKTIQRKHAQLRILSHRVSEVAGNVCIAHPATTATLLP